MLIRFTASPQKLVLPVRDPEHFETSWIIYPLLWPTGCQFWITKWGETDLSILC